MVTYWTTSSAQMAGSVSRVAKWASWTRRLLNKKPPATNRAGASPRTPRFCTAALVGPSTAVCVKLFPLPAHSREDTDDFRKVFGPSDPIDRQTQSFGRLGRQDTATVFRKLDRQLVITERTLRTAAVDQHLLDDPCFLLRRHGQDRRCLLREDGVAARVAGHRYSSHQRPTRRITDQLIGEVVDAEPQATAPNQGRCHRVGTAKLGLISGLRSLLAVQRLAYRVEHRGSDGQLCGRDFAGFESPLAQRQCRINAGVGIVVGWVRLKAQAANFPSLAQSFRQHCGVERAVDEATIEAVPPLECLNRSVYAGFCETCRLDGRFGGPAGLETLDRATRPVGFQRAAGEAHSDPDCVRGSAGFETSSRAATAAPATVPQIADASRPRCRNRDVRVSASYPALPIRMHSSRPTTSAANSSTPVAPCHSPTANTTGTITPDGCRSGIAISSYSSDRASSPFMKAACGAGSCRGMEIAVA